MWLNIAPDEDEELLLLLLSSDAALPRSHLARSRPGVSRRDRTVTVSSTSSSS